MARIIEICLLVIANIVFVYGQCDTTNDPCLLSKSTDLPYMSLRSPDGAYVDGSLENEYCDLYALNSYTWYRSEYAMTTECVAQQTCNTNYPIWLNGTLPTSSAGIVDGSACLRTFESCCERTYALKVKNCSYYSVYCFEDLPSSCPQRFCFDVDVNEVQPTVVPDSTPQDGSEEEDDDDDGKGRHHSPLMAVWVAVGIISIVANIVLVIIVVSLRNKVANLIKPKTPFVNVCEAERPCSGKKSPPPAYEEYRKY